MTAFEESWKFLKALPEQTMFLPPSNIRNLTENPEDYRYYEGYKADDRGNRAVGTVHPAIQSLLRRISTTDNVDEQGNRISNLNLNAYRENALRDNRIRNEIKGMIVGHPERNYNMSRYTQPLDPSTMEYEREFDRVHGDIE